jgi:AcrR family transcriptional regulator
MGIAERRGREKEKRRQEIIDAAERTFFSRGLDNATMEDVARDAELSKGTLYLYFKSKEDLYLAIILRGITILRSMFDAAVQAQDTGLEKINAVGRAYIEFYKHHRNYFNAMLYFESSCFEAHDEFGYASECADQSSHAMTACAEAVQAGIEDGTIRTDLNAMKVALTLYGLLTGLLQIISLKGRTIRERHGVDPEELIDSFFGLIRTSLQGRAENP